MRGSEGPRGLRGGRWGIPSLLAMPSLLGYRSTLGKSGAVPWSFLQSCVTRCRKQHSLPHSGSFESSCPCQIISLRHTR